MLEFIATGGWAMWVITGCSVIALGITLERLRTLRQADVDADALLDKVATSLAGNDIRGAMDVCARTSGPVAETLAIGLRKLVFLERIGKKPEEIEEGIVAAMEEHGAHVVSWLEKNLTSLATIASLAPILGMMGTVLGMISSFGSVAKSKTMTPDIVAGGISEALHCTAGGLIVAALATVAYNYFTGRVNRFVLQVQTAGTDLVERLLDSQMRGRKTGSVNDELASPAPVLAAGRTK